MALSREFPPEVLRHLIQRTCGAPNDFNILALSHLCVLSCVSREWRRLGQPQLRAALARWGLRWDANIWYGTPTLGWLGTVRENTYRNTDYAALDGGDDGLLSIRPTVKTDLRRSDHRRYIAEKFCKHGSVEQVLRLFCVLPTFERLHPARGGWTFGGFFEHLELLFSHPANSHDSSIARDRFPVVQWFLHNWNGFFLCFEGEKCSYWDKQQVLDECLGMVASTRNRHALRLWRKAGAQMVKHDRDFDRERPLHMWRTGSIGAWGEIFNCDCYSVRQEHLRLFEACIMVGPRFVRQARESGKYAGAILDALATARDEEQYARIARGVRRRWPFKSDALQILPQDMQPWKE